MQYQIGDLLKIVHPVAICIYEIEYVSINNGTLSLKCIQCTPSDPEDKRYRQKIEYINKILEEGKILLNNQSYEIH